MGQRFWRITGGYFTGAASARVWAMFAVLLLSVIASVRIEVLLSYYNNDLYSALQVAFQGAGAHNAAQRNSGVHGFWIAIGIFCILATIHIARIVFDTYLTQRFIIRWRVWLTDRLTVGLAHRPARTTAAGSPSPPSTTPISASSRTSTSSPPGWVPAPTFRRTTRRARCFSGR